MNVGKFLGGIGDQIRDKRLEAGLTQRELGERSGIVGKYVSEIERGTRDVPISTLLAIVERGLLMDLQIVFRGRQSNSETILPVPVEDVARTVAELPADQQTKVVAVFRRILDLMKGVR